MHVRSDRTYLFDRPLEAVWDAIGRTDAYRARWPWLRRFDADGLAPGEEWHCTVRPPLPYVLRFSVTIEHVDEPTRIDATVAGDLCGDASLDLTPTSRGCSVRLVSALEPAGQPLRAVMVVSPWLARFGHDWVLDTGLRQFRRHL
jgi:uncharacterized protein YndB with AHSA1/START domain